jgi:3-phenylpropionate/trans-cinnamate dioxygenase ferredoxin subunit
MNNKPSESQVDLEYIEVAKTNQIKPGERLFLEIDGLPIVVFNIEGLYFAIGDICTHDQGTLGDGELDGYQVVCPRHGARFDLRDGKAIRLPAVTPTPSYPVRVNGDAVELGLPAH